MSKCSYARLLVLLSCCLWLFCTLVRAGETDREADALFLDSDSGVEVVLDAQEGEFSRQNDASDRESTEDKLQSFMDACGFMLGWDDSEEKRVFFAHGIGQFDVDNPSTDATLIERRELAVVEAILRAKSDVIASIFSSDFSAVQRMEIPGTPEYAAFSEEFVPFQQELNALAMQLRQMQDEPQKSATWVDNAMTLLDGQIQRIAFSFGAEGSTADKQPLYENVLSSYSALEDKYDKLMERAEKMRITQSTSSDVSLSTRMPLVGGTVVHQVESWDPDTRMYSVGVVLCWSKQLQVAACATLSGEAVAFPEAARGPSMGEWLKQLDYSEAIGPRQFLDDKGRFQMIGISAMPVGRNAPQDTRNRRIADLNAQAMTLLSLFADVDVASDSSIRNIITEDEQNFTYSHIARNLKEFMTQSFTGKSVSGLQPRRRVRTKHRRSGHNMHVSVYAISAEDAAKAMQMRDANALAVIRVHKDLNTQWMSSNAIVRGIEAGESGLRGHTPAVPVDPNRVNVNSRNLLKKTAAPMPGIFY